MVKLGRLAVIGVSLTAMVTLSGCDRSLSEGPAQARWAGDSLQFRACAALEATSLYVSGRDPEIPQSASVVWRAAGTARMLPGDVIDPREPPLGMQTSLLDLEGLESASFVLLVVGRDGVEQLSADFELERVMSAQGAWVTTAGVIASDSSC